MGRIFDQMMRHPGPNDVWVHQVNGVTVVSYSNDPFEQTGNVVASEPGSTPRKPATKQQIEIIHRLAGKVSAFYGDAAVGVLPELPKRKRTKRAA